MAIKIAREISNNKDATATQVNQMLNFIYVMLALAILGFVTSRSGDKTRTRLANPAAR